jgi:RND family efflux transporter MFP subunit
VVATLDAREYELAREAAAASLSELEVRLAQARRDLSRAEELAEAKAATAEEVEQVRAGAAALEAARSAAAARRNETRRLCDESVLRAPFAGTVTEVRLEPGEWVMPGQPVIGLSGDGVVEVLVEAPEPVRARLEVGQPVEVGLPFSDRSVTGSITQLAAAASGPGRLFPVEVTLPSGPGIVSGLTAEVVLTLRKERQLVVPLAAVLNPGSSTPAVFRIAEEQATLVPVQLGRMADGGVEVVGSLAPGDLVAISGHTSLADGDVVEVRR